MFLPWSLITGRTKKQEARRDTKLNKLRRPTVKVEHLEDRLVPANFFVDASYVGAENGSLVAPFRTIQDALIAATNNPGPDNVFVYGNNSSDPAVSAYVWERDGDANLDGILDGNMDIGSSGNSVAMYFRANLRDTSTADGSGGAPAGLIVKMRDNIVDVQDGSQLRIEGTGANNRVIFTSIFDDDAGGDTNGDDLVNAPQRTNWGGIRFRAEAIDQGATSATGSLVNYADIRYSGQTIFDEVVGFPSEFASIRMEANALNPANVRSAQVRVWNTVFRSGGRALDINVNALGDGGKASSVITGPDLGAATAQPLTFEDNSINGAFIFVPADTFTGFLQQLFVNARLDDVGVPYALTQRLVIGSPLTTNGLPGFITLTFDAGTILKSQNTVLDGIDFGEPNDRTYGTIRVNGTANRPVLFTSLSDDGLVPGTDLAALYNNGSADTNNDGSTTSPAPGDWGGIRIAEGNIDHAVVRFGGGNTQINGTFVNSPPIRVFARDLTPAGLNVQQVRISNTEVTQSFSLIDTANPFGNIDSPAIDLFSRDDGDTRFAGPFSPIVRTGDVQIMDNYIHDNLGKAIAAHPLYFHDARNSLGGYGVFFRRNILENNANNGVFVKFILDRARGIDQNFASVGSVLDDTDIVTVIEGEGLIIHPDQYMAIMSRRTVTPDTSSGGYLQKFTDVSAFINSLVLRLPGNLPTNTTLPNNLPLQRGPIAVNPGLVDSGLFYYQTNFDTTARNVANGNGTAQRGEEWRDWGVDFVYGGDASNVPSTLFPFRTVSDPSNPGGFMFQPATNDGNGSYEMVFPNAVSAVGFWIVNNQSNSPTQRIELIGADGRLIETAAMPTTAANGRTYFGRVSRTPIHKVRIVDEGGDAISSQSSFGGGAINVAIPGNGVAADANLVINSPTNFSINDVRVNLSIVHPIASELRIELVAPDGTVVQLARPPLNGTFPAGANYTNTFIADSFTTPITAGVAPYSGNFYPSSADPLTNTPGLGVLNGKNVNGTWKLRVVDTRTNAPTPNTGSIVKFGLTFKGAGLTNNNPGITGLTWVDAGENLVVKANTEYTTITAGSIASGYAGVTQDANGVINNGFLPQMTNVTNGTNPSGQFTFGQNTNTVFTMNTATTLNPAAGDTVIPLDVGSDFVANDLTVRLNMTYNGPNSDLRIRLRGPDGSEIDLVGAGSTTGNGFTNTVFDDTGAQAALNSINIATQAAFTAPYTGTFETWSFSNTRTNAPTTITPFGTSFYRGKNVRGQWSLVVTKSTTQSGTVQNFTVSFRAPTSGWGSTLRILGQGANPVIMTGIDDDTVGAGPIGRIQRDTGNDGDGAANAGQWRGIRILAGVNSSLSEVVTQNPNGTLNRRYADLNPYTRGDEGLTYPGINNPNGAVLSYQDQIYNSLAGLNGSTAVASRAPFDSKSAANFQDGTLVEFAEIRFATTGIEQRGYPKTKLAIDGNEFERDAAPNGSVAANEIIQPVPALQINQNDAVRFVTTDGTYTVAGRIGGSGDGPATDDVDWYELPSDTPQGRTVQMYIDLEMGRRTAGFDEPRNRQFSIAVFNHEFQLLYWSGAGFDPAQTAAGWASGNTLGPIILQNGDQPYNQGNGFQRDSKYIAVMPFDRVPRSFVSTNASPAGLLPDTAVLNYGRPGAGGAPTGEFAGGNTRFQADFNGADGGPIVVWTPGNPPAVTPLPQDSIWDPAGPSGTTVGGYEMQLRFTGFERHANPVKPAEGQILLRSNTILNSAGDGIALHDLRMAMSNQNLGETMPLLAARFPVTATNSTLNSTGNPFRNEDINNVNPAFSAPANFVPGVTVHNNLLVRNGGDGISLREDRNTNAISPGNALTPTAFTEISNNTIDNNSGVGINLLTRGGPTVQNNIVTNNGTGLSIVDGYDINNLTPPVVPAVSYNIFYNNAVSGSFTGTQNLIGNGTNVDPQFVDPSSLDYRVRLTSPAIDSAISDLQDRLRSARFPQVPTRTPNLDLRGRSRVDNPSRPNVGSGAFPFYDRGALETNELSLRVIGLSVLADNQIVGAPVSSIVVTFAGRVDLSTFNSSSVSLRIGTQTGTIVPLNFNLMTSGYDKNTDTHVFTIPLVNPITDGTYVFVMNGTATGVGVRDIAGQLLDGEFPAPYLLPSGNGSTGGTFAYPFTIRTGQILGNIWENRDGDTVIDLGEPGIGNVGVNLFGPGDDGILFTADDEIVATTTSSAAGAYSFINLGAGRYYVGVDNNTLPADFRLNTPPALKQVNIPIGGIRANLNFGYWLDTGNAVVTGYLFNDLNGNGLRNPPAEGGIGFNLPITLTSGGADFNLDTPADNVVYNGFADLGSGFYQFLGTSSDPIYGNIYRLEVDETGLPATFVRTSPLVVPIPDFFLTPGASFAQDYGYQEAQATVTGIIFEDANGNAIRDGGEVGIGSVNMILRSAGIDGVFDGDDTYFFTSTDGTGNYNFTGLPAGLYRVSVDATSPVLATYFLTTGNATQDLTLTNGNGTFPAADIGYRLDTFTGQILGFVFNDVNGNGFYEAEPGISPVNVRARWAGRNGVVGDSDDQVYNVGTLASGQFNFTGLPVGDFYLEPTSGIPAGFGLTTPASLPLKITLGFGAVNTGAFFGYQVANSVITGSIFNDLNGDGTLGGTETGRFAGVRVFIDANNNGLFDIGERNAFSAAVTGVYSIDSLPAGTYRVKIDAQTLPASVPAGFAESTGTLIVTVGTSATSSGNNLGLQQRNAQAIGRVFIDINNNGAFDANEVGSPGQTVTLTFTGSPLPANFTNPQTYVTGSDGTFSFTGLPAGSYSIQTTVPNGGNVPATPGNPQSFTLGAGGSTSRIFPIQFGSSQSAGVWYFTFAGASTTLFNSDGSVTVVADTDIVRMVAPTPGVWQYDVYFQGSQFGLSQGGTEAIDAFTFTRTGEIIISTKGTFSVSTNYSGGFGSGTVLTGFGEDLMRFTPSAPSTGFGLTEGSWSVFFDGSDVGLSGASENVDAVSIVYSGTTISRVLLSTTGTALVNGGISANPQDVFAFKPTTTGATTSGTFNKFFVGTTFGLSNPTQHNVDALYYLPGAVSTKPSLFISTSGNFNVPFAGAGTSSDMLRFNATGGGPVGLLTGGFNSVALRGTDFGHGGVNVTGFWLGATQNDPDPFGGVVVGPGGLITLGGNAGGAQFASLLSAPPVSASGSFADSSSKTSLLSSSTAKSVASSTASKQSSTQAADQLFTTSKRSRTTAASLAKNLLARFA